MIKLRRYLTCFISIQGSSTYFIKLFFSRIAFRLKFCGAKNVKTRPLSKWLKFCVSSSMFQPTTKLGMCDSDETIFNPLIFFFIDTDKRRVVWLRIFGFCSQIIQRPLAGVRHRIEQRLADRYVVTQFWASFVVLFSLPEMVLIWLIFFHSTWNLQGTTKSGKANRWIWSSNPYPSIWEQQHPKVNNLSENNLENLSSKACSGNDSKNTRNALKRDDQRSNYGSIGLKLGSFH